MLRISLLAALMHLAWTAAGGAAEATVRCRQGAVVSVSEPASEIGLAALRQGGSAVDSAVATAFALAVTYPAAGNLGGGGFLVVAGPDGNADAYDFREVAPAAATPTMFVDPARRTPHRRVGVPGTVRGLELAHRQHGLLAWADVVRPAVELARSGFALDGANAQSLNELLRTSDKQQFAELHRVFGKPDGGSWQAGDRLVQPELAKTLARIAAQGADGFYAGETADKIVAEMQLGAGLITAADLRAYSAKRREPLRGSYRGYQLVTMPPPSSGGTTLIEALNILETFDLDRDRWSVRNVHLTIEAMRRAYRDRARYLGDPDFVAIPARLTSKEYARDLAANIDPRRATRSQDLAGDISLAPESPQTTHLSVIDRAGLAVSLTYTLESSYGSRVVVRGAGFLLNDEMNDFGWLPGVTDSSGRIGTKANLIAPHKRMLSSMCPTIVLRNDRTVLITGSPGGRTIINTVLCIVSDTIDFGMSVREAVAAPRWHHPWFPDAVRIERQLREQRPQLVDELEYLGHKVVEAAAQGDAHSIAIDPESGEITAAADTRISGHAAGY
ncbi:MAG: gamma-glutamyltransferase [Planctomycetaceae bacterium]|nr:gamma-glutamyltransferase [Planctomycetaceae bacterium]